MKAIMKKKSKISYKHLFTLHIVNKKMISSDSNLSERPVFCLYQQSNVTYKKILFNRYV